VESRSLADWLVYLENLHPFTIDLGLDRVRKVKNSLCLTPSFPVITVGGTNGKGSICAMLETILSVAGYRVGCYTSPHLLTFNERIRISQQEADSTDICRSFEIIENARLHSNVKLTYFEFGTLAAMHLFLESHIDVAILEIGLGGRLDAVNIFDADCAILASIDLDHMDYLGETREKIGLEKIGIFRKSHFAICSEPDIPPGVQMKINAIGAKFFRINQDFNYSTQDNHQWNFYGPQSNKYALPYPALRGDFQLRNACACLAALDCLSNELPVNNQAIRQGLVETTLKGRFQVLPGSPMVILDVAHNPAAAKVLAKNLEQMESSFKKTYAVIGMLKDKDIASVIQSLKNHIDVWLVGTIHSTRGAQAAEIASMISDITHSNDIYSFSDLSDAYAFAHKQASKNDRICVFGSFYTVSAILAFT